MMIREECEAEFKTFIQKGVHDENIIYLLLPEWWSGNACQTAEHSLAAIWNILSFPLLLGRSWPQNIKDETTFLTEEEDEIQRIIFENEYDAVLICSHFPLVSKLKQWGYKGKVIYEIQGLGDFVTLNNGS